MQRRISRGENDFPIRRASRDNCIQIAALAMRADYGNQRPGFRFSHTPSVFDQHPRLSSPTVAGDPLVRGDLADLVATIRTFLTALVVDCEEVVQLGV